MKSTFQHNMILNSMLLIVITISVLHSDYLDDLILLENRNPGYWYYLSPSAAKIRSIENGNVNTDNQLIIEICSMVENGVSIKVNEDSSITVDGTNTGGDIYLHIFRSKNLLNGNYYFQDGGVSSDSCYLFSEAWNVDSNGNVIEKTRQTRLPDQSVFTVEHNRYTMYWFGIAILSGTTVDNKVFYPYINEKEKQIEPAWMEKYPLNDNNMTYKYIIEIPENSIITEKDWEILKNSLKSQYPFCNTLIINYTKNGYIERTTEEFLTFN